MAASVNYLQKQLAHGGVDSITDKVGVESFKNRFAGKDLGGHCGGMSHAAASDGLDKSFFNNAVLDVQRELTCALLRRTPTDTVREAADVGNLFCFNPIALFGNGSRIMHRALADEAHIVHLMCIFHCRFPFILKNRLYFIIFFPIFKILFLKSV